MLFKGAAKALVAKYPDQIKYGIVGITLGAIGEGGLSSSAAIGVAYLLALEDVNNLKVSNRDNILLDKAIENGYIGLKNGERSCNVCARNH